MCLQHIESLQLNVYKLSLGLYYLYKKVIDSLYKIWSPPFQLNSFKFVV